MTFSGRYTKWPCYLREGESVSAVVQLLPTAKTLIVRTAADVFLDSLGNPNTVRN